MDEQQILIINDLCGTGKVATAAMLPILSYMGHPTYTLPTALVSNTLEYAKFSIVDTTDYIRSVFPVWRELGFSFSAIATGFIASERQAGVVSEYCRQVAAEGTTIYVDPIMGDEGRLYNGVTPATVDNMREMAAVADLIYPNYTEACYLAGQPYREDGVTEAEAHGLLDALHGIGAKSVLITSIPVDGCHCVAGYNHFTDERFLLPYQEIPVRFPGTGDIFSAVLIGHLLNGEKLPASTQAAMDAVYKLIELNQGMENKKNGIPIERFLNIL